MYIQTMFSRYNKFIAVFLLVTLSFLQGCSTFNFGYKDDVSSNSDNSDVRYIDTSRLDLGDIDTKTEDLFASDFAQETLLLLKEEDLFPEFNRSMHEINLSLIKLLNPAAKFYRDNVNDSIHKGLMSFFRNLREPLNTVNSLLQGDFTSAANNLGRFVVNTTVGLGGFIDWADDFGMEYEKNDFGKTLAVWGVPSGKIVYLPFVGPKPVRRLVAYGVDAILDPLDYILLGTKVFDPTGLFTTNMIRFTVDGFVTYADAYELIDVMVSTALDSYTSLREYSLRYRVSEILSITNDRKAVLRLSDFSGDKDDLDDFDFDDDI